MINSSSVSFEFSLRIPGDGNEGNKEFEIIPKVDFIKPGENKKITIKFTPYSKKVYNLVLVIDIVGIGKDMKSIPIYAECGVPDI